MSKKTLAKIFYVPPFEGKLNTRINMTKHSTLA